jgi:hypothetical protein
MNKDANNTDDNIIKLASVTEIILNCWVFGKNHTDLKPVKFDGFRNKQD